MDMTIEQRADALQMAIWMYIKSIIEDNNGILPEVGKGLFDVYSSVTKQGAMIEPMKKFTVLREAWMKHKFDERKITSMKITGG